MYQFIYSQEGTEMHNSELLPRVGKHDSELQYRNMTKRVQVIE